jgi:hypothetical protein
MSRSAATTTPGSTPVYSSFSKLALASPAHHQCSPPFGREPRFRFYERHLPGENATSHIQGGGPAEYTPRVSGDANGRQLLNLHERQTERQERSVTRQAIDAAHAAATELENKHAALEDSAQRRIEELRLESLSLGASVKRAHRSILDAQRTSSEIREQLALSMVFLHELEQAQHHDAGTSSTSTGNSSSRHTSRPARELLKRRRLRIDEIRGALLKLMALIEKELPFSSGEDDGDGDGSNGDSTINGDDLTKRLSRQRSFISSHTQIAKNATTRHGKGTIYASDRRRQRKARQTRLAVNNSDGQASEQNTERLKTARLLASFREALADPKKFCDRVAAAADTKDALSFPAFSRAAKASFKGTHTFNDTQLKALFRGLDVDDTNTINPVAIFWSFSVDCWLVSFHPDTNTPFIINDEAGFGKEHLSIMDPLQRSKHIFAMYSSARQMSMMQWAAFVRDSRLCNNRISYSVTLDIFERVVNDASPQTMPPNDASVPEQDWFRMCHALIAARMYRRDTFPTSDFLETSAWKAEVIEVWDVNVATPLAKRGATTRPAWQDMWLFDRGSLLSSLTYTECLWSVFLTIASEQQGSDDEGVSYASALEMDLEISRKSVAFVFGQLGVIPRMLDLQAFGRLADRLHLHSALASENPTSGFLFPEFFELCLAIAAQHGDTLSNGCQRLMLYFNGNTSISKAADDVCRVIHEHAVVMQRQRVTRAFMR